MPNENEEQSRTTNLRSIDDDNWRHPTRKPIDLVQGRTIEAVICDNREHGHDLHMIALRNQAGEDDTMWLSISQLEELVQLLVLLAAQMALRHSFSQFEQNALLRLAAKLAHVVVVDDPVDSV